MQQDSHAINGRYKIRSLYFDNLNDKALLEKVNPKYAVISLGKDNSYGHPHKSTLKLLDEFGVETYRTDENGTVVISTEGSGVTIKTGQTSMKRDE